MKYQVWIKAHDPKTLAVIGEVLIFEHEDRLVAEQRAEGDLPLVNGALYFGDYVLVQKPLYRTENRIPGWGKIVSKTTAQVESAFKLPKSAGGNPIQQRCQCRNPPQQPNCGRCLDCGRAV